MQRFFMGSRVVLYTLEALLVFMSLFSIAISMCQINGYDTNVKALVHFLDEHGPIEHLL